MELDRVYSEFGKVQQWNQRCAAMIKPPPTEEATLLSALTEVYAIAFNNWFDEFYFGWFPNHLSLTGFLIAFM